MVSVLLMLMTFYSFAAFDDYEVSFSNSNVVTASSAPETVPESSSIVILMLAVVTLFLSRQKLTSFL